MIVDDKLMKYVVFKRRTESEMRMKCKKLGYNEEYIEEIIEYLKENEYINDSIYVEKYIKNVMRLKKSSIFEIRMDLLRRGINENLIENYVSHNEEELQEFENESALKIMEKKIKTEELEKIKRYLKNKGYSYSSISQSIDNLENLEDNN